MEFSRLHANHIFKSIIVSKVSLVGNFAVTDTKMSFGDLDDYTLLRIYSFLKPSDLTKASQVTSVPSILLQQLLITYNKIYKLK